MPNRPRIYAMNKRKRLLPQFSSKLKNFNQVILKDNTAQIEKPQTQALLESKEVSQSNFRPIQNSITDPTKKSCAMGKEKEENQSIHLIQKTEVNPTFASSQQKKDTKKQSQNIMNFEKKQKLSFAMKDSKNQVLHIDPPVKKLIQCTNTYKKILSKSKDQTIRVSVEIQKIKGTSLTKNVDILKVWQELEQIEKQSQQITTLVCSSIMNEPITQNQLKTSNNIRKTLKEKATSNIESLEFAINVLTEQLEKSGLNIIFSQKSSAKSQISMKTLNGGFMQNHVRVVETIPDNDPTCPFKFQDLENTQKFKSFSDWYKLKIQKQTGLNPQNIVIHSVARGSIKVQWSTSDSDKLNESFQTAPELEDRLKLHRFFQSFHLSPQDFDIKGNIQFNEQKKDVEKRGGWPYFQPVKCKRYGINISKKFDNGDDTWLEMRGKPRQWAVAFHGVKAPDSFIMQSIMGGLETKEMLKVFPNRGQAYQHTHAINSSVNDKVGAGIYCTPHIQVSFQGYTNPSAEYAVVFQCRVNPKKIKVCSQQTYWVINSSQDIRPYGIVLIKNTIRSQYPSIQKQFENRFKYSNYKKQVETFMNLS